MSRCRSGNVVVGAPQSCGPGRSCVHGDDSEMHVHKISQCPPKTVYPALRKSSAKSISICTAASNGIGFKCA